MEANQTNPSHNNFETLMSDSYFSKDFDWDKDLKENTSTTLSHYRSPGLCIKDEEDEDSEDLGPRLEPTGFSQTSCKEHFKRFVIIRPAYTLGETGGGIAYNREEFETICKSGLDASLTSQVLVEKSLLGWKECELEVMRDLTDNVVIICSIENIDPMGVHTEDSITVAPAQTLTDKEYHRLRDYSIAIIREIGVECGGSNIQFAVNPVDSEVMVIEMNPRVSRSSALASKATGFPIAKMAAKLSVGYTLDQIPNDITKKAPASFEPSIDYVVTKIPRFAFEKFLGSQPILTTQMKSVGESMALGRTFQESFNKAVKSLECGYSGWGCVEIKELDWDCVKLKESLRVPSPECIHSIYAAMRKGMTVDEIHELSCIDKWFLTQLKDLVDVELYLSARSLSQLTTEDMYEVKKRGFSDKQIAFATKSTEKDARIKRLSLGVAPAYKRVDTCAAEFEANTPYMYSCYDNECESLPTKRKKVLILGGGPNRIDQGFEFDYCCCHTSFALQEAGFEIIMLNSNPETVSTDYDTSDRLYFEPLTVEDVLNILDLERPDGKIVQFGEQTAPKLALPIEQYLNEHKLLAASEAGYVRIWRTSPDSIDAAEDRERFNAILNELKIEQPKGGIAKSGVDVEGGNLIRTVESIINGGDLHFAEIIYTNGPKGMRVFNVFLQGEKVLSELDIYSVVGANKPLQLLDARVSVGEDGEIALSFEGVHGSPVVSRICIRRAPKPPDPLIEPEYLTCNNCATEIPLAHGKIQTMKRKQYLMICLAEFPPPGAPSFAAMVSSGAASNRSVGHPKKSGNSISGGGNKSQVSLQSLKFKFSRKKPALESMVIAYQWVRGCFLEHKVGRLKIIRKLIPQDWMLHGLWPPKDEEQCYDDFDEEKIRDILNDLLQNWASLKIDSGDVDGHVRFWKRQWTKHGVKSRLSQKLYMKLALHLHGRYKNLLTAAMNTAKSSHNALSSFDSALGIDIFTIRTSAFVLAVSDTMAVPRLKWIKLGENKYALKEVQLKISLLSENYEVEDMDNTGGTPPLELIV